MGQQFPPYGQQQYPAAPAPDKSKDTLAIVGLVAGVIGLCAWLIPICGFPIGIAALVCSYLGLQSSQRTLAYVGLALGGLCLLASILNAIAGVALVMSNN